MLSLSNSTSFVRAVPFGPRIRRHSPSICDPSPDLLMQQAVRSSRCLLATERILMLVACAAGRQPGRSLPPHAWFIKGCDPQSACGVAEIRAFALAQSNRDSIFFFSPANSSTQDWACQLQANARHAQYSLQPRQGAGAPRISRLAATAGFFLAAGSQTRVMRGDQRPSGAACPKRRGKLLVYEEAGRPNSCGLLPPIPSRCHCALPPTELIQRALVLLAVSCGMQTCSRDSYSHSDREAEDRSPCPLDDIRDGGRALTGSVVSKAGRGARPGSGIQSHLWPASRPNGGQSLVGRTR